MKWIDSAPVRRTGRPMCSGAKTMVAALIGTPIIPRPSIVLCLANTLCLATATVLCPATAAPAQAQDMVFSVEETGEPPAPPAEGPPSEALANALRLYQNDRYMEAGVQLQRVVEGETQDAPANVQKAQFFLAKALYHIRFYQSALAIFDEITQQGQGHVYFGQTLQWLAQLAAELPEPAGIIEKVGRYPREAIAEFDNAENAALYNHLIYLLGRHKYQQSQFDEAVDLFQSVSRSSDFYVYARFFEGVAHVRALHARPAVAAFRAVIEAIEGGVSGVDDTDRMRDLAWLSLARVYYTAANRQNPEDGTWAYDGRLLGNAVEAWNRIGAGSEYWLDALFEASWAFYLADEYARAMGNVHTLFSPFFQDSYYPEALVLKSVIFFTACQIENAEAMVNQFHERYDPIRQELETTLSRFEDNEQFFQFLTRVRAGEANVSASIRGIVSSALSDRTLLRHVEYVRLLESEETRLGRTREEFRTSSLGNRILQDIFVAKSFAIDRTGDLARDRYNRLVRELDDLMTQVDTVIVEITSFRRDTLSQEMREQLTSLEGSRGLRVEVDEEHQVWPFNGEYWRDELGFYRQQVTSQCSAYR